MLYELQVATREPELDHQRLYLSFRADLTSATSSKSPDYVGVVFASWSLRNDRYKDVTTLHSIIDGERVSYDAFMPAKSASDKWVRGPSRRANQLQSLSTNCEREKSRNAFGRFRIHINRVHDEDTARVRC